MLKITKTGKWSSYKIHWRKILLACFNKTNKGKGGSYKNYLKNTTRPVYREVAQLVEHQATLRLTAQSVPKNLTP